METVIEDGTELVSNVKLAADHLQVQHRRRLEERQKNLKELLVKEEAETKEIVGNIADNWPKQCKQYENYKMKKICDDDGNNFHLLVLYHRFNRAPTDLYSKILDQKSACNDLLKKRNDLIRVLEAEVKDADNQYKTLVEEFHENTSVLGSRMEHQVMPLFNMPHTQKLSVHISTREFLMLYLLGPSFGRVGEE